ncbi:Zinc finger, CCHC-type superfamily [Sesbania bispinosa]|nr:Zinc finger, CCHC-type superfamily [Sesbania bispinosa]
MWAIAHIHWNFFVGFKTTSQCKDLHSQVGRDLIERACKLKVSGLMQTPVCNLTGKSVEKLNVTRDLVRNHLKDLRQSDAPPSREEGNGSDDNDVNIKDRVRVRTKGCDSRQRQTTGRGNRRANCCSVCHVPGHNKKTCPHTRGEERAGIPLETFDDDDTNVPMADV